MHPKGPWLKARAAVPGFRGRARLSVGGLPCIPPCLSPDRGVLVVPGLFAEICRPPDLQGWKVTQPKVHPTKDVELDSANISEKCQPPLFLLLISKWTLLCFTHSYENNLVRCLL